MHTLTLKKKIDWDPPQTDRAVELMHLFGVRVTRLKERRHNHTLTLRIGDGQICFFAGSSGTGKSLLLNSLWDQIPPEDRIRLDEIELEDDKPVIDCLMPGEESVWWITHQLNKAGLSDLFAMLHTPAQLSTGQQWRYRLAKAIDSGKKWVFVDEFANALDRITACVLAIKLRKLATETGRIFVLASCNEDMMLDLRPDVVIIKYSDGTHQALYQDKSQNPAQRW